MNLRDSNLRRQLTPQRSPMNNWIWPQKSGLLPFARFYPNVAEIHENSENSAVGAWERDPTPFPRHRGDQLGHGLGVNLDVYTVAAQQAPRRGGGVRVRTGPPAAVRIESP